MSDVEKLVKESINEIEAMQETIRSQQVTIEQLLAVIAVKDEALNRLTYIPDVSNIAKNALESKPDNTQFALSGYTSKASIKNLESGNDVIVGKKSELRTEPVYTIKHK